MATDLKNLDKKLAQVMDLVGELRELEQAAMLKQGIIDDIMKDVMQTEMKYPRDAKFSLAEIMFKLREMSGPAPLIVAP